MLRKGMKLFGGKPAKSTAQTGPKLDDATGVQNAIAGFAKVEASPVEKRALALRIIRAAQRFNIIVSPGSLIGKLAGMKA